MPHFSPQVRYITHSSNTQNRKDPVIFALLIVGGCDEEDEQQFEELPESEAQFESRQRLLNSLGGLDREERGWNSLRGFNKRKSGWSSFRSFDKKGGRNSWSSLRAFRK